MTRLSRLTRRQWLIVIHDLLATAAALLCTLFIRFEDAQLAERLRWMPTLLIGFVIFAAVVYFLFGLHEAKWRFTSMPEMLRIIRAIVGARGLAGRSRLHPGRRPIFTARSSSARSRSRFYFVIQIVFLSATRIAYRYFREGRTQRRTREVNAVPTLILGRAADVEVPLRAIESGAISNIWPVGLLVAGALRSGRERSRRAGARRLRRSRRGRRADARARHAGRSARADAVGLRARQRRRVDPDAGAAARADDQSAAVAGRNRQDAAARAGGGRRPAAAAEREDRLRPAARAS